MGAAAVGAAAYGAYGAYNNCYDAYGNYICGSIHIDRAECMPTAVGPVLTAVLFSCAAAAFSFHGSLICVMRLKAG